MLQKRAVHETSHCGCEACTDKAWNTDADGYTCGDRISWLLETNPNAYPTEESACLQVAGTEFPAICGAACDPSRCNVKEPIEPPSIVRTRATHCGCITCTDEAWNADADGYTCGDRISWLLETNPQSYPTEESACLQVAGTEFPAICGATCDPSRCSQQTSTEPLLFGTNIVHLAHRTDLYCFPPYESRMRWTNVWSKYIVEVKEATSPCGPGDNRFSSNTVDVSGDTLTMHYKKINGVWTGSEVRIVLPESEMPFKYGSYSFSISSVSVIDTTTNSIVSSALPDDLVIGLFTWDDTESYAIHENWNHEVDIEISRWNNPTSSDVQFLVQPPGAPHMHRFHSGAGSTYAPGGHIYKFDWNPGRIDWYSSAGGGKSHSYITDGSADFIQCLPADVELRINVWNMRGALNPNGYGDNHRVEVTIDNFTYVPSGKTHVPDGGMCSKDCMCASTSGCVSGTCVSSAIV
jgi:hypothetical protein